MTDEGDAAAPQEQEPDQADDVAEPQDTAVVEDADGGEADGEDADPVLIAATGLGVDGEHGPLFSDVDL